MCVCVIYDDVFICMWMMVCVDVCMDMCVCAHRERHATDPVMCHGSADAVHI